MWKNILFFGYIVNHLIFVIMKELSIEEKAKAYDVAIERAKSFIENGDETERTISESIFAGLMDVSEDENIRKELIECLKHNALGYSEQTRNKWFAWLEKHGEQKSNPYSGTSFKYNGHIWGMCARDNGVDILLDSQFLKHFENQGEQKPDDKVEPKFKIGDWVRAISSGNIFKILSVNDGLYRVLCYDGVEANYSIEDVEKDLAYWTIQDAKAGDVLADDYGIYIFEKLDECDENCFVYIGAYQYSEKVYGWGHMLCSTDVHPATKEQRDLLFSKMKEAGYEWDAEKKELKKIEEQNPAENTCKISDCAEKVDMTEYNNGYECGKQRVLKYPEDYGLCKKSAWSEEDENMLDFYEKDYNNLLGNWKTKDVIEHRMQFRKWLKSLKERYTWKPSDKQM